MVYVGGGGVGVSGVPVPVAVRVGVRMGVHSAVGVPVSSAVGVSGTFGAFCASAPPAPATPCPSPFLGAAVAAPETLAPATLPCQGLSSMLTTTSTVRYRLILLSVRRPTIEPDGENTTDCLPS